MTGQASVSKGIKTAQVSRGFFDVQLRYADVLSRKAGIPLHEAIAFHTNFHRLFAYGNLSKMAPQEEFVSLVRDVVAISSQDKRLDQLIAAFAVRPLDPWPADRFPFGRHFACEAPNEAGIVRIHFRNHYNGERIGPLHASNIVQRRADLAAMFGFIARRWPQTKAVSGASWLYNTQGYRRLFPPEFVASRTPLLGRRPTHGLSTWGQFLDFRGCVKLQIAERFYGDLNSLDPREPWLAFPYAVLATSAPFEAFRREFGL